MARGRLRIYLGAAPGVGKTVSMLTEGARRAARGTDVVVAVVETHGRPVTEQSLAGLEMVPRRIFEHRGTTLTEMDLDAVLARRPQVALVDELAHTNAPGSRHEKRWQDVEELLQAGIDVVSTVNIQHLESLNDATRVITGVLQRETVPDAVVRSADQIELVDMSPESLRRRMAHGNIYRPEKVDAALSNYFRVGNLAALRELALLWLADRVDEGLARYRESHDIDGTWPTRERVVVALTGGPEGRTLLRRAARIVGRGAGGELLAVHVVRTDGLASADLATTAALRRLTEELGGSYHTVTGDAVAEAVLGFARRVNASQVVVGTSRRSRLSALLSKGVSEEIVDASGEIDVHLVTHEESHRGRRGGRPRIPGLSMRRVVAGWLLALLGVGALTTLIAAGGAAPDLPQIVLLYLALTVAVAIVGGLGPACGAAVTSYLAINWYFTPPLHTLTVADPQNSLALVIFIVVAVAVASVVHLSARRTAQAVAARQEAEALLELSQTLLGSTEQLGRLLTGALDMFDMSAAAVVRRARDDTAPLVVEATEGFPRGSEEAGERPVLPGGKRTVEQIDQEHDLVLLGAAVAVARRGLLRAWAAHAAAILARRQLQRATQAERGLARENEARAALLSAVSHDLRTPLAGIKAAAGSLRSQEIDFSPEDEAELLEAIEESTDRLDALIANLLDASRVQTGSLTARCGPVDLGALVPAIVSMLSAPARVSWSVEQDARTAWGDAGLLERVLVNLAENSLRHAPSPAPIHLGASAVADRVELRVVDRGPGIPAGQHEEVFRPFQRYGDAPSGDGVGLGLAVARGLTEAMGGTVTAEDTPGGGLTMVVALPAEQPLAAGDRP